MAETVAEETIGKTPLASFIVEALEKGSPLAQPTEKEATPEQRPTPEPEKKAETVEVKPEPFVPDNIFEETKPSEPIKEEAPTEPVKEQTPAELKGKARENFEKLASKAHDFETKFRALEREHTDFKTKYKDVDPDATKTKIIELERELQTVRPLAERVSLEMREDFQRQYSIPIAQNIELAKKALNDAGADSTAFENALSLSGKPRVERFDEILGEITSPLLKKKVENAIDAIDRISSAKDFVLKNQKEWLRQAQERERVQQHEAFQNHSKQMEGYLDEAVRYLRDEHGFTILKQSDDPKFDKWNGTVKTAIDNARRILVETDNPKEMAVAAVLAATGPVWKSIAVEEHKARVKAEKALKDLKGSEPDIGGGRKPSTGTSLPEDMDFTDAVLEGVRRGR